MSNKIAELKNKRMIAFEAMKAIHRDAGDAGLDSDKERQFDAYNQEITGYDTQIRQLEELENLEKRLATKEDNKVESSGLEERTKEETFEKFFRYGNESLTPEERSQIKEMRASTDPNVKGTDAVGGFLVPETWSESIERVMLNYGSVMNEATVISTTRGGTYNHPVNDDTGNSAFILGEAATDTTEQFTLSNVTLNDYKYSAGNVKVSSELLTDSNYNLQSFIADIMGERLGRGTNAHFSTGTGTSQPQGIATGASAGITAASATAFTRDELVNLIHSVDVAYRGQAGNKRAKWMMNDGTLAAIRKLAFGTADDRPLYQASATEGAPDRIEGYNIVINNDLPDVATGTTPILFGDFSKYLVRRIGSPIMKRSDDRFIEQDVVAFFMFARYDGKILVPQAIKKMKMA